MPDPATPSDDVARAADLLRRGRLVAFPTETVYGLGVDATNADAVSKIFAAKCRPATNPLVVHAADLDAARRCAGSWPASAERIARAFWPGPVTVVVPRGPGIVDGVTAGGPTVGLRVPDHPIALALLRAFGGVGSGAVAAPSANRSNRVSPTTAGHVADEFGEPGEGRPVSMILDGGPCRVGIESTVVDCTGDVPTVLRPGGVTAGQLSEVIGGPVRTRGGVDAAGEAPASPGRSAVHYAPRVPAFRFDGGRREEIDRALHATSPGGVVLIASTDDPERYAETFYARLRGADGDKPEAIWIELPPDRPEWAGVRDRILRATRSL